MTGGHKGLSSLGLSQLMGQEWGQVTAKSEESVAEFCNVGPQRICKVVYDQVFVWFMDVLMLECAGKIYSSLSSETDNVGTCSFSRLDPKPCVQHLRITAMMKFR